MNDPYHHRSSSRLPPRDQMIMGLHALTELLRHAPQRILRVYTSVKEARERKHSLLRECEQWNIPVVSISETELSRMCGSDSHQSFAAHVKGREFLDVKEFLQKVGDWEQSLVLLCDEIFDPQNFGALLRCAECFGADGLAWSKNRGSDLTPVAAKASCGASEWMTLIRVSNLAEAVTQFQKGGYEVVASVLKPGSQNAFHFHFKPKTVLVVGSEGEGIQPLIQKRADHLVYLPMLGKIESLNVAQAATALLTCYRLSLKL
ncbi:MAG: 23S rRNA (guanosine(2251)-2'-O)-methyltransferase RlmB [Verrucomicrobiota bacterium]|nr:23S rRNA (guanosine(2251)-2'-O)-methyltransferase RlmB [Verrucomicrobiota bacterium]